MEEQATPDRPEAEQELLEQETQQEARRQDTAEEAIESFENAQSRSNEAVSESQNSRPVDPDDVLLAEAVRDSPQTVEPSITLKAVIEAAIYITDEPLTAEQIATATEQPLDEVRSILAQLAREYAAPDRGLAVREIAGGYKMSTKAEYHEAIRQFVRKLQAPLKLSLAALETLAVIAYKQPITGPEILEIRGVQGAGVVKTLLDRKLIVTAGRKKVLGKPMMYKTSHDFLVQFGLNSLAELPTLKEFEELGRMALSDEEEDAALMAANQTQLERGAAGSDGAENPVESSPSERRPDA